MTYRKKIHDFADRYLDLYKNRNTTQNEVIEGFSKQCFAFDFKMDCGEVIENIYPQMNVLYDACIFESIVGRIDDISLLGSAIFSKWRYITHWAYSESLLSEENRLWFVKAFTRMVELTEERNKSNREHLPLLKGQALKIYIISNGLCYGPCPMPEDEVEQHLTLYEDGRVCFAGYNYGNRCGKYERGRSKQFKIAKEKANRIFAAYNRFFSTDFEYYFATDIGSWDMIMINTEGEEFKFNGSLFVDFAVEGVNLSELMREELGIENLWVFDGDNKPDIKNIIT